MLKDNNIYEQKKTVSWVIVYRHTPWEYIQPYDILSTHNWSITDMFWCPSFILISFSWTSEARAYLEKILVELTIALSNTENSVLTLADMYLHSLNLPSSLPKHVKYYKMLKCLWTALCGITVIQVLPLASWLKHCGLTAVCSLTFNELLGYGLLGHIFYEHIKSID